MGLTRTLPEGQRCFPHPPYRCGGVEQPGEVASPLRDPTPGSVPGGTRGAFGPRARRPIGPPGALAVSSLPLCWSGGVGRFEATSGGDGSDSVQVQVQGGRGSTTPSGPRLADPPDVHRGCGAHVRRVTESVVWVQGPGVSCAPLLGSGEPTRPLPWPPGPPLVYDHEPRQK